MGMLAPNLRDQASLYRCAGPFQKLVKQTDNFEIHYIDEAAWQRGFWADFTAIDFLFMHRPFSDRHLEIALYANTSGVPIWMDYDDYLFHVPWDNGEAARYNTKGSQETISTLLQLSSVTTVSTPELQEQYKTHARKIAVIPNALDFAMYPYMHERQDRKRLVSWRGSPTHTEDLMTMVEPMKKFAATNTKVKFKFYGFMPWMLVDSMPNQIEHQSFPHIKYMYSLYNDAPMIHIAPLKGDTFRRSKSNIAWIESTVAGAPVIASDLPEWDRPGVIRCKTEDDWLTAFEYLSSSHVNQFRCWRESMDYIKDNLDLDNVNADRIALIEALAERKLT